MPDIQGHGFPNPAAYYAANPVWVAVELTPQNVGKPSSNPPGVGEYQGFTYDRFDRGTEEQVFFAWHIPCDFSVGSASIRGHFGFIVENPPSGSGDEYVRLGFEYKKVSPGDVTDFSSGTSTGILTETIADGDPARKMYESATGIVDTTGFACGDIVLFRFFRDSTNIGDTYDNEVTAADNDVWISQYHLEYLSKVG